MTSAPAKSNDASSHAHGGTADRPRPHPLDAAAADTGHAKGPDQVNQTGRGLYTLDDGSAAGSE